MYKIVVTPVRTGEEEIIIATDFQMDDIKLAIYKEKSALTFLLHAVESVYVEEAEEN